MVLYAAYLNDEMIQQRIGDLLEIEQGGKHFYAVVLTNTFMFGGNILFAFHNEGKKCQVSGLAPDSSGFNICADLLLPKREGRVERLHHYEDVTAFWRSKYAKATNEHRLGVKPKEWFIYNINDLGGQHIARVAKLTLNTARQWIDAVTASNLSQARFWQTTRPERTYSYERRWLHDLTNRRL